MRRPFGLVLALVIVTGLFALSPLTASAHANLFRWNVYNNTCARTYQRATAYIEEQGTTGATWMRITSRFQRWYGYWQTTRSHYVQSRRQFRNNHNDHDFSWTKRYNYRGDDFRTDTRILFVFQWFNNNTLLETSRRSSSICRA
jgi:hypothetical protein